MENQENEKRICCIDFNGNYYTKKQALNLVKSFLFTDFIISIFIFSIQ